MPSSCSSHWLTVSYLCNLELVQVLSERTLSEVFSETRSPIVDSSLSGGTPRVWLSRCTISSADIIDELNAQSFDVLQTTSIQNSKPFVFFSSDGSIRQTRISDFGRERCAERSLLCRLTRTRGLHSKEN